MNTSVTPITIKGKPYIQVAGRVSLAHEDDGFSMIESSTFELANRYFVRVTIEVKGKRYIGTSEVKLTAKAGTADGDSPLECAETSALGRALGYAGYGSVDSIASADEVLRNEQQRQANGASTQPPTAPTESNGNGKPTVNEALQSVAPSPQQLTNINKLVQFLGRQVEQPTTYYAAKQLIAQLSREYNESRQTKNKQ